MCQINSSIPNIAPERRAWAQTVIKCRTSSSSAIESPGLYQGNLSPLDLADHIQDSVEVFANFELIVLILVALPLKWLDNLVRLNW